MAKNRVAPDRPITIKRDNFFTKSKSKKNRIVNNDSNKNSEFLIKPSKSIGDDGVKDKKKPFDKKKWRLQKYSNKYKLQQWEDKRKKSVLRGYYKSVKDDENQFDVQKIYNEGQQIDNGLNKTVNSDQIRSKSKGKAFKKAQLEFERIKEEKRKRKEEILKRKQEKTEALKEYRKKKTEKFKKLSKKTRKGQPVMKERMEMLLEKIQNSLDQQ